MRRTASKGLLAVVDGASMTAAADVVILPDSLPSSLPDSQAFCQPFTPELPQCAWLIDAFGVGRRAMQPNRACCTGLHRQQSRAM